MKIALYLTLIALVSLAWILILIPSVGLSDAALANRERLEMRVACNRLTGWLVLPLANVGLMLASIAVGRIGAAPHAETDLWILPVLAIQAALMLVAAHPGLGQRIVLSHEKADLVRSA